MIHGVREFFSMFVCVEGGRLLPFLFNSVPLLGSNLDRSLSRCLTRADQIRSYHKPQHMTTTTTTDLSSLDSATAPSLSSSSSSTSSIVSSSSSSSASSPPSIVDEFLHTVAPSTLEVDTHIYIHI